MNIGQISPNILPHKENLSRRITSHPQSYPIHSPHETVHPGNSQMQGWQIIPTGKTFSHTIIYDIGLELNITPTYSKQFWRYSRRTSACVFTVLRWYYMRRNSGGWNCWQFRGLLFQNENLAPEIPRKIFRRISYLKLLNNNE